MAILAVKELPVRGGTLSDDLTRTYYRTFRVSTDTVQDATRNVRLAPGLPALFSSYIFGNDLDILCFCIDIDIKQDQDWPLEWLVTAKYSSKQNRPQEQQNENPLLRAPEYAWSFAEYQRPFVRDLTGRSVVNSASVTFDPPPETEDSRPTLVITRNEAFFNPALALQYQDATNTDLFYGAGLRQAKFKSITADSAYENGITFQKVKYEVQFRREGFFQEILDQGFCDRNGKIFRDRKDGLALSNPTPLDGDGQPLYVHQRIVTGPNKGQAPYQIVAGTDNVQTTFQVDANPPGNPNNIDGYLAQLLFYLPPYLYDGNNLTKPSNMRVVMLDLEAGKEIVLVTKIAWQGNNAWTVTCIRGYAGTAASTHPAATLVKLLPVYLRFREFKELPFGVFNL
jgi:hypothetical protein